MGLRSRRLVENRREKEVDAFCPHPLCVPGIDRHVRDAYLHAIAFAALANDEVVTAEERRALSSIGMIIGFPIGIVDSVLATEQLIIEDCNENQFMSECVGCLPSREIVNCFLSDFDRIWDAGCGAEEELRAWHADFARWMKCPPGIETASQCSADARSRLLACLMARRQNVGRVAEEDCGSVDYGDVLEARDDCDETLLMEDGESDGVSSKVESRQWGSKNAKTWFDDDIEDREE